MRRNGKLTREQASAVEQREPVERRARRCSATPDGQMERRGLGGGMRVLAAVVSLLLGVASLAAATSRGVEPPCPPAVPATAVADPGPDFNGDGFADLAIGAPNRSLAARRAPTAVVGGAEGAVVVLYGSFLGLTPIGAQLWTAATPGVPGDARANDNFGFRLATGDFDADGFADLAVGKPAARRGGGKVVILRGSRNGLSVRQARSIGQSSPGVPGDPHRGEWFGGALATGDVDGDGRADLVVGAPSDMIRGLPAGSLTVFYGSRHGLRTHGSTLVSHAIRGIPGTPGAYDGLGTWLAVGDVDGDGFGDVAAGASGDWVGNAESAGTVLELPGSPAGVRARDSRLWTQTAAQVGVPSRAWDRFGHRLAIGDLNGDGYGDLVAGAPTEAVGGVIAGATVVLYGSTSGLATAGAQLVTQASPGVTGEAEDPDQFGFGLSAGDVNGDACAELVVGVPGDRVGTVLQAGAVNLVFGSRAAVGASGDQLWSEDVPGVPGDSATGDSFGLDTALGDFDGDGHPELVIGAGEDVDDGGVPSGGVLVLSGTPDGPSAAGSRLWSERELFPGVAAGEDGFGLALAATG